MKTILRILERAGGYRPTLYLKIENPPFMALVIEATPEPGPCGLPAISARRVAALHAFTYQPLERSLSPWNRPLSMPQNTASFRLLC
jgi:hypothetical protein